MVDSRPNPATRYLQDIPSTRHFRQLEYSPIVHSVPYQGTRSLQNIPSTEPFA
jgi:hypothetical protein